MKVAAVSLVSLLLILGRGDSARVREQFAAPEDIDSVFPVAGGQNVTSSSGLVRYVQLVTIYVDIEADKNLFSGWHRHSPRGRGLLSRGLLSPVCEGGEVLPAGQEVQEVEV